MQQQNKKVGVEIAREEHWEEIRDCTVNAFLRYPLYTYLIPNEKIRPIFLRRYLDAIYDVCVRNGTALLLCVSTYLDETNKDKIGDKKTVIGGAFTVPASETGGWKCSRNEDFEDAYKRYKLYEIDAEAMKNLERYENWEYERISKHITQSGMPLWNGIFCAIDPRYACRGLGSLIYIEFVSILRQIQHKAVGKLKESKTTTLRRLLNILSPKKSRVVKPKKMKTEPRYPDGDELRTWKDQNAQFLFALTHDERSLKFHTRNGMRCVAKTACDAVDGIPPFDVHILVMDAFNTGKLDECMEILRENYDAELKTIMSNKEQSTEDEMRVLMRAQS